MTDTPKGKPVSAIPRDRLAARAGLPSRSVRLLPFSRTLCPIDGVKTLAGTVLRDRLEEAAVSLSPSEESRRPNLIVSFTEMAQVMHPLISDASRSGNASAFRNRKNMSLEITCKETRGVVTLTLVGPLTFGNGILVFRMVFDGLVDEGKVHLALNLTKLSELDAAGAETLLYAIRQLQKAGGDLAAFGLRRSLIEPRVEAKLEPAVKAFATEQEAVDSFFPKHYDVLELVRSMKQGRDYSPARESF